MIRGLGRILLAAAFCSLFFLPMAAVQAAPTTMTVCGVSSQGSEQGAIANARKKAMFKALRYLITPQNPLFRQLMGEYEQYTAQPQVFNQQKDGSKLPDSRQWHGDGCGAFPEQSVPARDGL